VDVIVIVWCGRNVEKE